MTSRGDRPTIAAWRRTIIIVETLMCVAAVVGAMQLIAGVATPPDRQLPLGLTGWQLPGIWLLATVAVPSAAAAVLAIRRSATAPRAVFVASTLLVVELVVQMPFLGLNWLQAVTGATAIGMSVVARAAAGRQSQDVSSSAELPASLALDDVTVDLYWLPLGAGGHSVRFNGRVYEAAAALHERRPSRDLYHSALEVHVDGGRYVIEMAPVWNGGATERGAVCQGAVGARLLERSHWFRYEVRRWRDGRIPDLAEAVASPQTLTRDPDAARCLLELVPSVPALVWGRDELGVGDMWNSNSLIAWLLARANLLDRVRLPQGGRAPGWSAGVRLAHRQGATRQHNGSDYAVDSLSAAG